MNALHMLLAALFKVIDDLHHPVVVVIPDGRVPVTRHLMIEFRDRRGDGVGVQVACSRCVVETNDVAVFQEPNRTVGVIRRLVPPWQYDPVVVLILVMIACDLLLVRTNGVGLHVRVKQATAVSHIFQRKSGAISNFCESP